MDRATQTRATQLAELSPEDRKALDDFFSLLLSESEMGYVLFGIKPLCTEGIYAKPYAPHQLDSPQYFKSQCLMRGIQVWKRLGTSSEPITLTIDHVPSPDGQWYNLVVLNRPAVLQVVADNLSLFQSILGPATSPKTVLAHLENPNISYIDAIGNSKILSGILMGFGTENSIHYSRIEELMEYEFTEEVPPLKTRHHRCLTELGMFETAHDSRAKPSISYSKLQEELDSLTKQVGISRDLVGLPIPVFGCLRSDITVPEAYAHAHPLVQDLIEDPDRTTKILDQMLS